VLPSPGFRRGDGRRTALSEREAGSDRGVDADPGPRPTGDDWILNGAKCWITNGGKSTWYQP